MYSHGNTEIKLLLLLLLLLRSETCSLNNTPEAGPTSCKVTGRFRKWFKGIGLWSNWFKGARGCPNWFKGTGIRCCKVTGPWSNWLKWSRCCSNWFKGTTSCPHWLNGNFRPLCRHCAEISGMSSFSHDVHSRSAGDGVVLLVVNRWADFKDLYVDDSVLTGWI